MGQEQEDMGVPAASVADILERAADRLSGPGKWTQASFARNADGGSTASFNESAVCWCAVGAIGAEAGAGALSPATRAHREFLEQAIGLNATEWNDDPERTQEEVVAKLREAAALARTQSNV